MLQKIKNWFNDAKNNDEYFYKNFFIKVILIIIIILVIAFIFTKIKVNSGENEDGDKSFYNNLNKMKTAALNYFDENNIPKEINESKKISLNKLIKNNKLKTLTDSNSNICDGNNSYIKITKKQDNYQIKINLTCAEDNDYIIIHVNNYDYCTNTFLCEEKEKKSKEITKDNNDEEIISTENSTDTNNKKSSSKNSSSKSKNSTKKSTTKKLSSTYNTIKTSKGTIKVSAIDQDTKLFQYAKTNNPKFSSWTSWTDLEKTSCDTKEIVCDNNPACLKEIKVSQKEEIVSQTNKKYSTTKRSIYNSITSTKEVCEAKEYIIIDNIIYTVDNINSYREIYFYSSSPNHNLSKWIYVSRESYDKAPDDTYNTHYFYVGVDYSNCTNTCNNNPKFIYDKYIYTGDIKTNINFNENNCKTANKSVYYYVTTDNTIDVSRNENIYGKVCYKTERNRSLLNSGATTYKWSNFNDKRLLNNGYYYTGKTKKK